MCVHMYIYIYIYTYIHIWRHLTVHQTIQHLVRGPRPHGGQRREGAAPRVVVQDLGTTHSIHIYI